LREDQESGATSFALFAKCGRRRNVRVKGFGVKSSVIPPFAKSANDRASGNNFNEEYLPSNRIVIPTGPYPDILLRIASDDRVCGSL
jgi:hypothetical protein